MVVNLESVEANWVTTQPSRTPEWLLWLARDAVRKAGEPGATEKNGLEAILFIVTAGEAILNWLLEPLVTAEEFYGTDGKRGIENLTTMNKWVRLSELLKMKPTLRHDAPPLKPFLDTTTVRHDVLHFKYGRNIRESRGTMVEGVKQRGKIVIPMGAVMAAPQHTSPMETVEDKLEPARAAAYFATLTDLLQAILPIYPDKKIVSAIQKALTENLWFSTPHATALWDVLVRAQIFAEKSVATITTPVNAAQDAAAGALLRIPKLLSGVRLLLSEGLLLEAYLLVRSLAELATTLTWVGLKEEYAGILQKENTRCMRAWVERLKRHGVTNWPDETTHQVSTLVDQTIMADVPSLDQRAQAVPQDTQDLYEFTRDQTAAATHCGWGQAQLLREGNPGSGKEAVLIVACDATMRLIAAIGPILNLEGAQALSTEIQTVLSAQ